MKRIAAFQDRSPVSHIDMVVGLALVLVPLAYVLGLRLDWSEADAAGPMAASAVMPPAAHPPFPPVPAPEAVVPPADGPAQASVPSEPDPDQRQWDEMVKRLEIDSIAYPGRVAIYLKDLRHDRVWTYHADDLFPSASLIKVPILASVFQKIHDGELSLRTVLTLRRRHRVGGSGSLKWYRDGTQFTVRQLLDHMIDESDNTATRMMIEATGLGYLQQHFRSMGLVHTEIYPEGMSLQSSRVTYENYTTAREMAMLLERLYRGQMVDPYSSELMLDIMKHQKTRARLAKALPARWEIAHKTGLLRGACHDTAVIFTPQGDFVMAVLTGQNRNYGRAKDFITHLGRVTYRYYRGDQSLYAKALAHHSFHRRGEADFN